MQYIPIITLFPIQHIAGHMEMDIKQALVTVINNNCTCGFLASQINQGEFSCRNMVDGHVTYRLINV